MTNYYSPTTPAAAWWRNLGASGLLGSLDDYNACVDELPDSLTVWASFLQYSFLLVVFLCLSNLLIAQVSSRQ